MSSQNIYRSVGSRHYMIKKARDLKEDYQWQAKQQYKGKILTEELAVNIILYFKDNRVRDWDNWHKISMDALSGIVWQDDKQIIEAHVFKEYDPENPRIEVVVV